MLAKRCPICGGKPQFVHYCIPGSLDDPDGLYILLKRIECKECGASVAQLVMTCDDAVKYWNETNPETSEDMFYSVMEQKIVSAKNKIR